MQYLNPTGEVTLGTALLSPRCNDWAVSQPWLALAPSPLCVALPSAYVPLVLGSREVRWPLLNLELIWPHRIMATSVIQYRLLPEGQDTQPTVLSHGKVLLRLIKYF